MTVTKLLTGEDMPLGNVEYIYWQKYLDRKAFLEEKAQKDANKKRPDGKATQEFKRTMGPK